MEVLHRDGDALVGWSAWEQRGEVRLDRARQVALVDGLGCAADALSDWQR